MNLPDKTDSAQDPSDDLPTDTAHRITKIVTEPVVSARGSEPKSRFRVTVTGAAGVEFTARIAVKELATYSDFRRALFNIYGCNFISHRAEHNWSDYIVSLIGEGSV